MSDLEALNGDKTVSQPSAGAAELLNGRICCALDLPCCIPPTGVSRVDAQADAICNFLEKAYAIDGTHMTAAKALLAHFDLVPPGVGKAIAKGYDRFLRQ